MRKYDLSVIMKRAWELKKEDSNNIFSICLKMAWEEEKGQDKEVKISIKSWFQSKMENENGASLYSWGNTPVRETAKAILLPVTFQTSYGREFTKNCWIPKICLGKDEKKFMVVEDAKKAGIPLLKRA